MTKWFIIYRSVPFMIDIVLHPFMPKPLAWLVLIEMIKCPKHCLKMGYITRGQNKWIFEFKRQSRKVLTQMNIELQCCELHNDFHKLKHSMKGRVGKCSELDCFSSQLKIKKQFLFYICNLFSIILENTPSVKLARFLDGFSWGCFVFIK